jgi:hypothetical protein
MNVTPQTPLPAARPMRMRAPAHETSRVMTPLRELALLPLLDEPRDKHEADDEFSRCGWFDSSLELAAGLQVIEFVDALPSDLPLILA